MRIRAVSGRALASAVGVHETTVSSWVNDRGEPERESIAAVARHLDVDVAWLAWGEGDGLAGDVGSAPVPSLPIPSAANRPVAATKISSATKIGARLQSAMTLRQLRTRDLANAVGSHETRIVALLQDRVTPALPEILKLAAALEVTVGWLAFGHEHEAPSRTLQGRDAYLTPLEPPSTRVPESSADQSGARTAVQAHIAQGQQQLAQWLIEYSASLLEAAAADARQQLGAVLDHEGNPVPHEDSDAEVEQLTQALQSQVSESMKSAVGGKSPARKRSSGA